ncbi:hypothetical protein GCM10011383_44300 [Hymenobacter cavernae]|uniref:Uncharacterized protein n=1 Tax=Hymenobacter cavernae TaxID=2044852 RepID=A0ABQ1UV51_9BACT|nr:hypothetical protein GCM10011383_44300 [Hymenobacter cavernae]
MLDGMEPNTLALALLVAKQIFALQNGDCPQNLARPRYGRPTIRELQSSRYKFYTLLTQRVEPDIQHRTNQEPAEEDAFVGRTYVQGGEASRYQT